MLKFGTVHPSSKNVSISAAGRGGPKQPLFFQNPSIFIIFSPFALILTEVVP